MGVQSSFNPPSILPLDFWRSQNGTTQPDGVADITESISHNGRVVIGAATDSLTPKSTQSNGPISRPRPATIAVGANVTLPVATTVDVSSNVSLNPTAAGFTVTIPNPTIVDFLDFYVMNDSPTFSVNVIGAGISTTAVLLAPKTCAQFHWSSTGGGAWEPVISNGSGVISAQRQALPATRAINANTNNMAMTATEIATGMIYAILASGSQDVTGLVPQAVVAGQAQQLIVYNEGPGDLHLKQTNVGSLLANRFQMSDNLTLRPGQWGEFLYIAGGWRSNDNA